MDSISSTLCTCATMTLITPSTHLFQDENYWMVECEGHWLLQDDLNKVSKQHITYHVLKFNPYIPCCQVQYSLPRPGRNKIELDPPVHDCMRKDVGVLWGHAPQGKFSNLMLWDCFWGHFSLLQPYLQLLAGFNNATISLLRNDVATWN